MGTGLDRDSDLQVIICSGFFAMNLSTTPIRCSNGKLFNFFTIQANIQLPKPLVLLSVFLLRGFEITCHDNDQPVEVKVASPSFDNILGR